MKRECLEIFEGTIDILEKVRSRYPERVTTVKIIVGGISIPVLYSKEYFFPDCNENVCLKLFEKQIKKPVTEQSYLLKEQFANILYMHGEMIGIADAKCQFGILFSDPETIRKVDMIERMVIINEELQHLFSLQPEEYWNRLQEVVKENIVEVTALLNISAEMNEKTIFIKLQQRYQKG